METIAKVRERKGRLDLPVVSGKHLRRISGRTALQPADTAEEFITTRNIGRFESHASFRTRADSIIDNKTKRNGRRKNFIINAQLVFAF